MMRLVVLFFCVAVAASGATGQTGFPTYHSTTDLSFASPGALRFGLYGYDNPALLAILHQPDLTFTWTDAIGRWNDMNRWGLFMAVPHVGLSVIKTRVASRSVTDYKLSFGFGNRSQSTGISYGWSDGQRSAFGRANVLTLGTLHRPNEYVSLGLLGSIASRENGKEAVVDLAIRPLGTEAVTAFADYSIQNGQTLRNGGWSVGTVLETFPGVRLTGRYFNTRAFAFGLEFSLGVAGLATQSTFDQNGDHQFNTYSIRLGAYDRTVLSKLTRDSRYLKVNMNGPIKYQRFVLFDNSRTLSDFLATLDAAKDDESIAGIVINTSGLIADREMLWELREKLKECKAAGKKVIVYIDRPDMNEYHFASVADKIVLDPVGMIMLPGYVTGRTFLKGTLEKLGIGYDEWRFFKYKSATENLSRDRMSEADREQRQKLVDDFYKLAKADICEGRRLSAERFDQMINDEVLFLPKQALENGLADTLGRWDEVEKMVDALGQNNKSLVGAGSLERFNLPRDNRWGEPPRIAVIYALGVCAMDEGITARSLINDVEAAGNDPLVKGIVLRIDSPGGDGLASDYVAEAMKRAKKNKPVIVSQGAVAASGGYWLSMYADTIVAAPNTITGSIGVIGGWIYNKELKDKLGFTTDHVKAGKHADLEFGFTLPFLGLGIPDRNLSEDEHNIMELSIRTVYKDFVQKVADGRGMSPEAIDNIGQGRVWSGYDGKSNGLVDVLGGMDIALRIAKDRAGLKEGQEVKIVEYPAPQLIDFSGFLPRLIGIGVALKPGDAFEHLKFRLEHNGQPMPMLPLDDIETNNER